VERGVLACGLLGVERGLFGVKRGLLACGLLGVEHGRLVCGIYGR
jgi:hypothetical protein